MNEKVNRKSNKWKQWKVGSVGPSGKYSGFRAVLPYMGKPLGPAKKCGLISAKN